MGADRDIPAAFPDPPPPRPDRREAAIADALDRFDAPGAERAVQPQRRARPRWTLRDRPQFGILVAATLVAVICLPVLWVMQGNPRPEGGTVALDTFERMPSLEVSPPSATTERSETQAEVADAAREEPAISTGKAVESREHSADAAPSQPPLAPLEPPAVAPPAVVAMSVPAPAPAPAPAPPPPPPPPEPLQAEAVAVSAFRARETAAARGDWNACTLNDPARSLSLCKDRIEAAAPGARGRASAFLADGLLRGWRGDLDAAITAFSRAIEADPRFADAYLNRGLAYQAKGDFDRAHADLDKAVDYAPSTAQTYHSRSLLLRGHGKTRQADKDEDRALRLNKAYEAVITPRAER